MAIASGLWSLLVGGWCVFWIVRSRARMTEREGVERVAYERATSIAFVTVMVASVVHGLAETVADVAPLSSWYVWDVGVVAFVVVTFATMRRLT